MADTDIDLTSFDFMLRDTRGETILFSLDRLLHTKYTVSIAKQQSRLGGGLIGKVISAQTWWSRVQIPFTLLKS